MTSINRSASVHISEEVCTYHIYVHTFAFDTPTQKDTNYMYTELVYVHVQTCYMIDVVSQSNYYVIRIYNVSIIITYIPSKGSLLEFHSRISAMQVHNACVLCA